MNSAPQAPSLAPILLANECRICESFVGCRGHCRGRQAGARCDGWSPAENRDGEFDAQTGEAVVTPAPGTARGAVSTDGGRGAAGPLGAPLHPDDYAEQTAPQAQTPPTTVPLHRAWAAIWKSLLARAGEGFALDES